ncbi:MAG: PLP-dependent aminotransferase family protein [Gammaproteobacteria bacterium]|nr:PLP-dependent aminotransferase family protein [Gammaproteobacteria bacterium]
MRRVPASFLPPIALDPGSATPMYQQLSEWFRRAIIEGRLKPGQRVPSSRNLAEELKISRIPVLGAYEQLCAEGYLETFTGAGTCVARAIADARTKKPAAGQRRADSSARAHEVSTRGRSMAIPASPWLKNMGAFRVGLPALDHLPLGVWSKLVHRHWREASKDLLTYGDPMGLLPFREAIAEYLGAFRGVRCEAAQIMITTGSQQALQVIAHVLLDPGDRVWMEEPGYPGAHQALSMAGAGLIPVPVDHEGMDISEGIRRCPDARAVYITPSHQFPLGTTLSAARRLALLSWAAHSAAWIIEDDYDSEFRFGGRPVPALQGLDPDGRVIYIGTFSKVLFPALRLGYVVLPKELAGAFCATREATDTFTSPLYQIVMADFLRQGHFARHIRRMRKLYMQRRTALVDAIGKHIPESLEIVAADTGMHLVALLPPGIDDMEVSSAAARKGVSVRPLSLCCLKPPPRGGLIFGYGGASVPQINVGVRELGAVLRETRRRLSPSSA